MQIFHGNRERLFNYSSFSFEDFRSCAHDAIKDFIMNSSGTSNRMRLRFGFSVYPDRRISFLQHFSANDLIFNNIEDLVKIFTNIWSPHLQMSLPPPHQSTHISQKNGPKRNRDAQGSKVQSEIMLPPYFLSQQKGGPSAVALWSSWISYRTLTIKQKVETLSTRLGILNYISLPNNI